MDIHTIEKGISLPFELLLNREQLRKRVAELGAEISRDYANKTPVVVGVLKGCMIFVADLIRELSFPLEVEFISAASYRKGTKSLGDLVLGGASTTKLKDRHVLIVEGIIESGRTATAIVNHIQPMEPASIELVTLLDKPGSHRGSLDVKYKGFTVGNDFIIGYGLDNTQKYRNLPFIGRVLEEK